MFSRLTSIATLPIGRAEPLAEKICRVLEPACERVAIAGSVRRRKPHVKDIEILAIPRQAPNLLGEPGRSELDDCLDRLIAAGRLRPPRLRGPKQCRAEIASAPGINLDLFIVPPANADAWGMHLAVRTGPAEFANALVTYQGVRGRLGAMGLLPHDIYIPQDSGFQLWRILAHQNDPRRPPSRTPPATPDELRWFDDAEEDEFGNPLGCWCDRLPTPEESMVFDLYGLPFIRPEERA